jgi:hypothetical protein
LNERTQTIKNKFQKSDLTSQNTAINNRDDFNKIDKSITSWEYNFASKFNKYDDKK